VPTATPGRRPRWTLPPTTSETVAAQRAWRTAALCAGLALLLYVPRMGASGLWDPWEGHYAEVARQMLERHDFIELHWHNGTGPDGRKENVFWSKPVLSFWLMAGGLAAAGLDHRDQPGEMALAGRTEWAIRAPFVLLAALCVGAVAFACFRLLGRRVGLLAGAILATCPQFYFIARQAMTDMPFVAPMTAALCFFMLAMFGEESEDEARRARVAFWIALPLVVVPQVLLLALGERVPVRLGSLRLSPWVHAVPYAVVSAVLVWFTRAVRTARQHYLFLFYLLCGVAMLAKGLPGPVLPALAILGYVLCSGEWRIVTRAEIPRGLAVFALVAFPWFHGMLVRAGRGFWNEFFGHHHIKRLTSGVHGDKGTFEYFVDQLAFALFPWTALVPASVANAVGWGRPRTNAERTRLFVAIWALAFFTLFSLSVTRFHHYILPAVPPLAIWVAIWIDDLLAGRLRAASTFVAVSFLFFFFVTRDLALNQQRLIWLYVYNYARAWPQGYDYAGWLWGFGWAALLAVAALAVPRSRRLGVAGLTLVAVAMTWFSLNKYMVELGPHWSQKEVLATYYRLRHGPEEEILAWQMNWRGETFYTKAQVAVAIGEDNGKVQDWLRARAGRRVFLMCERSRFAQLRALLPTERGKQTLRLVDDRSNKFYLAVAEL
jgi:4-amino-4-deoxy-L-arabinose transferase-like glycosyltransferase